MNQQRFLTYNELAVERRISNTATVKVLTHGLPVREWNNPCDGEMTQLTYRQIMTHMDLEKNINAASVLRKKPHIHAFFAIHPTVDLINISQFHYLVYCDDSLQPIIKDTSHLLQAFTFFVTGLKRLHDSNIIHNSIHQEMFHGVYEVHGKQLAQLRFNGLLKTYDQFKVDAQYSESPYVAPLQIILEVLSSSIEPDRIEYKDFKNKIEKFWNFLAMKTSGRPLRKLAQEYFSYVAGAQDFLDYVITRYCTIEDNFVVKDKSKALGYLHDIDLFGLAMALHVFGNNGILIQGTLRKHIGKCVCGEYSGVMDTDEDIPVKHFMGTGVIPQVTHVERTVKQPTCINTRRQEKTHICEQQTHGKEPKSAQSSITKVQGSNTEQPLSAISKEHVPDGVARLEVPEQTVKVQKPHPAPAQPLPSTPVPMQAPLQVIESRQQTKQVSNERSFKNDPTLKGELLEGSGIKKMKVAGVERIIRSEPGGDYIVWKGKKLYIE